MRRAAWVAALAIATGLGTPATTPARAGGAEGSVGRAGAVGPANAGTQAPNDRCDGAPCIQVGTFNIEWLGTSDTTRHRPRTLAEVRAIANLIARELDLEVLVLQEINAESQEYRWLETALGEQGYKMRAGSSGRDQRVVLVYDDDEVDLLGDVRELPVRADFELPNNCRSGNLRLPLTGHFRAGQFDFLVVGVHLKSQIGGDCADEVRRGQAEDLLQAVRRLRTELREEDVILSGDFNASLYDASLSPLLASAEYRPLTRWNLRSSRSGWMSYLEEPYQEIIDHVVVDPSRTREWVRRSTVVWAVPGARRAWFLRTVSDHAPVWASFFTGRGDDDGGAGG